MYKNSHFHRTKSRIVSPKNIKNIQATDSSGQARIKNALHGTGKSESDIHEEPLDLSVKSRVGGGEFVKVAHKCFVMNRTSIKLVNSEIEKTQSLRCDKCLHMAKNKHNLMYHRLKHC